jgi:hypothetical protein
MLRCDGLVLVFITFLVVFAACRRTPCPSGQILVKGQALSLDTGAAAPKAAVYLLDHREIHSKAPSTPDGYFEICLPRGSTPDLVTDDWDDVVDGATDKGEEWWVPTINYEAIRHATIQEPLESLVVHTCAAAGSPDLIAYNENRPTVRGVNTYGMTYATENYLGHATADNRLFDAPSVAGSGGTIVALFPASTADHAVGFADGIEVKSGDLSCPVGYVNGKKFFDANLVPDATLGPDILFDHGRTTTDTMSGMAISVCRPGAPARVALTITDSDRGRGVDFGGPWTVPLRPGHYTLFVSGVIGGSPHHTFPEVTCAAYPDQCR